MIATYILLTPQNVVQTHGVPVVLANISQCESGGQQFNPDGSVVENHVSKDYGLFQINKAWLPLTQETMGLDVINSARDNTEFAIWLYNKYGTQPWKASRGCWGSLSPPSIADIATSSTADL